MKEEISKTQDKVIMNILKYLDTRLPNISDNKTEAYAKYLSEITELKQKRIQTILNTNLKRRITFYEIYQIAAALKVSMNELFTFDDSK